MALGRTWLVGQILRAIYCVVGILLGGYDEASKLPPSYVQARTFNGIKFSDADMGNPSINGRGEQRCSCGIFRVGGILVDEKQIALSVYLEILWLCVRGYPMLLGFDQRVCNERAGLQHHQNMTYEIT